MMDSLRHEIVFGIMLYGISLTYICNHNLNYMYLATHQNLRGTCQCKVCIIITFLPLKMHNKSSRSTKDIRTQVPVNRKDLFFPIGSSNKKGQVFDNQSNQIAIHANFCHI